jgi:hypothetical protein
MQRNMYAGMTLALMLVLLEPACSGDEPTAPPTTGKLIGTVTDASNAAAIAGVRVVIYDANSNLPLITLSTSSAGTFEVEFSAGTYYVRCSRQGYDETPPKDISPFPLSVSLGQITTTTIQMYRNTSANTGAISGTVVNAGTGVPNVLVVAQNGHSGYSGITDAGGTYAMYNIPADTCSVQAWTSGFVSTTQSVLVTAGGETQNVNLTLSTGTMGTVTGPVTFLATTNIEVDVSLLDPLSREVIPGLVAVTQGGVYTIVNVPPGSYLARATYRNDGKVVDPDWIVKNGEPEVVVSSGSASRPFSVTGAVTLTSPTNSATSTQPVDVSKTLLTLNWQAYSSADNYVPEVCNQSGKVIWGGFADNWTTRRVLVPKSITSVQFNYDSSATEQLVPGKEYRWRVYASKDDLKEPTGWKLISVSEDQMGLIRISP